MKKINTIIFCFFAVYVTAQNTAPSPTNGLNQNEVNVVRDGDLQSDNGGVIRVIPPDKGKRGMTITADTVAALTASPTPSVAPDPSEIPMHGTSKNKKNANTKKHKTKS